MSTLSSQIHIEGLISAVYTLIRSMLSSKNCVKCISQDGCEIFTTDAEHLLSNLDIEHPGCELLIQALRSHKSTKTETNTLLFMIVRLAKALLHLQDLGISSQTSLKVIRDAVDKISEKVQDISIPVIISEREMVNPQFPASTAVKDPAPKSGCIADKEETLKTDKRHFLITSNQHGAQGNMTGCHDFSTEDLSLGYVDTDVSIGHINQDTIDGNIKFFEKKIISGQEILMNNSWNCTSSVTLSAGQEISKHNSKSSETKLRILNSDTTVPKSEGSVRSVVLNGDQKSKNISNGDYNRQMLMTQGDNTFTEKAGDFEDKSGKSVCKSQQIAESKVYADSDPVFLRMSNPQDELDSLQDDIGWFFETTSLLPVTEQIESKSSFSEESSFDGRIYDVQESRNDKEEPEFLNNGSHNSQFNDLNVLDLECEDSKSSHDSDPVIPSCTNNDQFDSDFEDCFDDVENRKHSRVVVEPIPLSIVVPFDEKTSFMNRLETEVTSSMKQGAAMLHNIRQHYSADSDFEDVAMPIHQHTEGHDLEDDEFDSCFPRNIHLHASKENPAQELKINLLASPDITGSEHILNSDFDQDSKEFVDDFTNVLGIGDVTTIEKCQESTANIPRDDLTQSCSRTQFCGNVKKPTKYLSESSEIKKINSLLNSVGAKKSGRNLSISRRHFHDVESSHTNPKLLIPDEKELIHADANFNCFDHEPSCHVSVNNPHPVVSRNMNSQQKSFSNHTNESGLIPTFADSPDICEQLKKCESVDHSSITQLTCNKNNCSKIDADLSFVCTDREATDVAAECKARESLSKALDDLLLKKKNKFKSSTAAKVRFSSRHLFNDMEEQNINGGSTEGEINAITNHCSVGLPLADTEAQNQSVLESEHLKSTSVTKDLNKCASQSKDVTEDLDSAQQIVSAQCGSFSTVQSDALDKQGKSMPKPSQTHSLVMTLPESICCLEGCCEEMMNVARQLFTTQMEKTGEKSFNLNLVDCVLSASLQSKCPRTSGTAKVFIIPGLVIPCDTDTCEQLRSSVEGDNRNAMLVNGDVTSTFHHKGYKPTLPKQTFVYDGRHDNQNYDERVWASSIVLVLKELNVDLLLIKGRASDILSDMCLQAGILLMTNVPYNTLSVLSYLHGVDILQYIKYATQANVCRLLLQPVSGSWMDQYDMTKSSHPNFIAVINTSIVQTVLITSSSDMSSQLQEEKLWQCLHAIANAVADAKVLPGGGNTEAWCVQAIQDLKNDSLVDKSGMESVILEALADVFHDYVAISKLNSHPSRADEERDRGNTFGYKTDYTAAGHKKHHKNVSNSLCLSSTWGKTSQQESTKNPSRNETNNFNSYENTQNFNFSENIDSGSHLTNQNCFSNCALDQNIQPSKSFSFSKHNDPSTRLTSQNGLSNIQISEELIQTYRSSPSVCDTPYQEQPPEVVNLCECDNFNAKISAWNSAVDIVTVLMSFDSLIITGIDKKDMEWDVVL